MTYYKDEQEIDVLGADVDPAREILDPDPAIAAIEQETALVVQEAQGIHVTDADSYGYAGAFLTGTLKPALAEIERTFRPMQRKTDAAHIEVCNQRKTHEDPLLEAEKIIKGAMGRYITEEKRLAAQAERERQAAARKAADEEQLAAAAHLEDQGHEEAAVERLEAPTVPVMATPAPEPPKAAGTSARTIFKFRIINASKIGRQYLQPDEKKIRKIVDAMGPDAVEAIGGIEVYEEPVIAARAR